jgi:DNA-binding transcriptional LysR family regulator
MDGGQAASSSARTVTLGGRGGGFATQMNIKALHYLIALAECLNFSRAADRCAVTQPTLSIQVRKLEEYLGVTLFERNRARVMLTAEGENVLRLARVVVSAEDEILRIRRTRLRDRVAHYTKPTQPQIPPQPLLLRKSIIARNPND